MAKPSVIEARKAEALAQLAEKQAEIERKLDLVLELLNAQKHEAAEPAKADPRKK